ncbi:PREDICTED: uncharacterized protein LOC109172170 [Ipomoea nil]|uniref:uncharacterized protein LOC109172170 n=1 Tax=Ipomoea nil TaxID=35883 RepID=UPI0009010FE6|nr:PREDICTED: uncharacterized protein LOC109172170 [Ipomoea nil]
MSLLSWNCRGLGGTRTVRELLGFVTRQRPEFVFLMETKASASQVERVRVRLGFEGCINVDRVGIGGGLALMWKVADMASLLDYSANHINVKVTLPGQPAWRLTCFYGFPERSRRHDAWNLLRELKAQSDLPWVVIGDFNDIASHAEKRGVNPHPDSLIRGFNDTLLDCGLSDLGMVGYEFTWERGRGTHRWVEERLDRAVASGDWCEMYTGVSVYNLPSVTSDHSALNLVMEGGRIGRRTRGFRFESAWMLDANCKQVVESAWGRQRGDTFQQKVARCGEALRKWGGDYAQRFGRRLRGLLILLENLRGSYREADLT